MHEPFEGCNKQKNGHRTIVLCPFFLFMAMLYIMTDNFGHPQRHRGPEKSPSNSPKGEDGTSEVTAPMCHFLGEMHIKQLQMTIMCPCVCAFRIFSSHLHTKTNLVTKS